MAFNITRKPNNITPAFNHQTQVCFDTVNYNKANFKYIFDLYVNDTLVNVSKLHPRNDGTVWYEPSLLVQDYLSYIWQPSLTGISFATTAEIAKVKVYFGYEYLSGTTTVTDYAATGNTYITWNGVASYYDGKDLADFALKYEPNRYSYTSSASTALLNMIDCGTPSQYIGIKDNEKRNATFLWKQYGSAGELWTSDGISYFNRLIVNTNTGKEFIYNITNTGTTYYNSLIHCGIGIPQLNAMTWTSSTIPSGLSSSITYLEDCTYTVKFCEASGATYNLINGPLYFRIKHNTNPSKNFYTLVYRAKKGGWGYVPVYSKNYFNINVVKESYKSYVPYNYTNETFEHKVYTNESNSTAVLNTDWMMSQGQIDEYIEMIQSPVVYLNMDETYIPVIINDFESPKSLFHIDKMIQYSITVRFAYDEKNIK